MRSKAKIYIPRRDEEHPRPFTWESPLPLFPHPALAATTQLWVLLTAKSDTTKRFWPTLQGVVELKIVPSPVSRGIKSHVYCKRQTSVSQNRKKADKTFPGQSWIKLAWNYCVGVEVIISKRQLRRTTSYYQISSPDLTWTTARVYVVLVELRWPHQSLNKVQKPLLM